MQGVAGSVCAQTRSEKINLCSGYTLTAFQQVPAAFPDDRPHRNFRLQDVLWGGEG